MTQSNFIKVGIVRANAIEKNPMRIIKTARKNEYTIWDKYHFGHQAFHGTMDELIEWAAYYEFQIVPTNALGKSLFK